MVKIIAGSTSDIPEALINKYHIKIVPHTIIWEEAEKLAEQIEKEFIPVEMILNMTGLVLGINTEPRALALCGYVEE